MSHKKKKNSKQHQKPPVEELDSNTENEFSEYDPQSESNITYRGKGKRNSSEEDKKQEPRMSRNMIVPPKQSNFAIRTFWTLVMIAGFMVIVAAGHLYCYLFLLFITCLIFSEITSLKRNYEREAKGIPLFKFLNWYFFLVFMFYFNGKVISAKLTKLVFSIKPLNLVIGQLNLICFMLWIVGFLAFVLSLKKGYYRYQFRLFAWVHLTCLIVVAQCSCISQSLHEGIIWFVLPCMLVVVNDIFAYLFGFFFGRLKLIELSPKKTWEGFIGGAISTAVWAFIFSYYFQQLPFLTCPQHNLDYHPFPKMECEKSAIFIVGPHAVPEFLQNVLGTSVSYSEFQIHCIVLAIFSSLIAPFGGFFASGFKRAIKIKDFGDTIPGHGGMTDRFDCQLLMGTFTYLYLHQVVMSPVHSLNALTTYILQLDTEDQIVIYNELRKRLSYMGVPGIAAQ